MGGGSNGELFSWCSRRARPTPKHLSKGCFIVPPTFIDQSKSHGQAQSQWRREGGCLAAEKRGANICQTNQIIALVFWVFFKWPPVVLMSC